MPGRLVPTSRVQPCNQPVLLAVSVTQVETVSSETARPTIAAVAGAEPDRLVALIVGFRVAGPVSAAWVCTYLNFPLWATAVGLRAEVVAPSIVTEYITSTAGGVAAVMEAGGTTALRPPLERPTRAVVVVAHVIKGLAVRVERVWWWWTILLASRPTFQPTASITPQELLLMQKGSPSPPTT